MDRAYLLKISGSIGPAKQREFEKTIRFVFNMLPSACLGSHLAIDAFYPNHYYVLTLWRSNSELSAFRHSDEFSIIKGSFDTLGFDSDSGFGLGDVRSYQIYVADM